MTGLQYKTKGRWLLGLAALLGIWSLAGQFVYNRIIFFYVANSEYAAASIISLHLTGFLVGSILARRYEPRLEQLLTLCVLLTPLSQLLIWTLGVEAFGLNLVLLLILCFAFLLATMSGLLLVRLIESRPDGTSASHIVIADSLGSVVGAVVGGFFLVPKLGLAASFCLITAMQAVALISIARFSLTRRAKLFALAALILSGLFTSAALIPSVDTKSHLMKADGLPLARQFERKATLIYQDRTPFGVLSVAQEGMKRHLLIDARLMCSIDSGGQLSSTSQWFEGDLMAKHAAEGEGAPESPRIALVGLGCGTTLASLLNRLPQKEGSSVDVIDINPGIFSVQTYFRDFLPYNIIDSRVQVKVEDGFKYFTAAPDARRYDAVLMDVVWMQNMNSTHLFSMEMFKNVEKWLTPRGILSIWTEQLNPFSPVSIIIYRTLKEVFPLVYIDTSHGSVLFFATKTMHPALEDRFRDRMQIMSWMDDAARYIPVNRLDNLAMNRYRFDAIGNLNGEALAEEYKILNDTKTCCEQPQL